jgi:hypothetical protein
VLSRHGIRTIAENAGKTEVSETRAAKSDATGARNGDFDADLDRWVDACLVPLDDATKAGILATVKAVARVVPFIVDSDGGPPVTTYRPQPLYGVGSALIGGEALALRPLSLGDSQGMRRFVGSLVGTWVGSAESHAGVTSIPRSPFHGWRARQSVQRFVERATRLYEQGADPERMGKYVRRSFKCS